MEEPAHYQALLDAAVEKRGQWLESQQIPLLKDTLASYTSWFEGVMAMLIRKGLLREDPYNYDQAVTDIIIPKDDELPEFENSDEVSYRLAAFRRQLKFVCTEYPLDLQALGLARLKKLLSLISYINWLEMGESSKSPTTKAFARVFMGVRMGSDTMASRILKDSEIQIIKTTHALRSLLAELLAYSRESWKADVRRIVLSTLPPGQEGPSRREEWVRAIRRAFAARMPGKPWYPTLVEELVDEDLAEDAEARREKILGSLAVSAPVQPKTVNAPDGRAILLEAMRLLSRPSEELVTAISVLEENERVVKDSRGSGGGWLRRLFGSASAPKASDRVYKVEYAEPGVPAPRTETIDFTPFAAEVQKKSNLLASLATGKGAAFRRLATTPEGQLAGFVDKQLNELVLIHRRLGSLNTHLQARVTHEKKTARGIKIELLTIKNAIVKANQRRHDYKEKDAGSPKAPPGR